MRRLAPLLAACACQGQGTLIVQGPPTIEAAGNARIAVFDDPLAGAEVCALDDGACTETDAAGDFAIPVPMDAEVALTVSHPDVVDVVVLFVTDAEDVDGIAVAMVANAVWKGILDHGMQSVDPKNGSITAMAYQRAEAAPPGEPDPGVEGVAITLDPAVAKARYYNDDDSELDNLLTATGGSGDATFFDVPPGDYAIAWKPGSGSCAPRTLAWPDGAVVVVPGFVTLVEATCAVP